MGGSFSIHDTLQARRLALSLRYARYDSLLYSGTLDDRGSFPHHGTLSHTRLAPKPRHSPWTRPAPYARFFQQDGLVLVGRYSRHARLVQHQWSARWFRLARSSLVLSRWSARSHDTILSTNTARSVMAVLSLLTARYRCSVLSPCRARYRDTRLSIGAARSLDPVLSIHTTRSQLDGPLIVKGSLVIRDTVQGHGSLVVAVLYWGSARSRPSRHSKLKARSHTTVLLATRTRTNIPVLSP